jgi:hypothetical protein
MGNIGVLMNSVETTEAVSTGTLKKPAAVAAAKASEPEDDLPF